MDGLLSGWLLAAGPAKAAGWQFFLITAVVFILPFVLGQALAQALRLKDLGTKMGVVLLSVFLALAPFVFQTLQGRSWKDAIHWGIDLAGGTNLIYAIDREGAKADGKTVDKATLDKMVGAVSRRINPSGAEEVTVRRVGDDRIEVIIPGADRDVVEQKKALIVKLGSLEFAILANQKDHRREIELGTKLRKDQDNVYETQGGRVIASWRNVARGADGKLKDPKVDPGRDRVAAREVERVVDGKNEKILQFLVVHDPPERAVTGKYLSRVAPTMDENGQLAVSFTFNARGGALFSSLTGRYLPDSTEGFKRCLAVLLNGEIHTAPHLQSRISTNGQITGQFTREEVDELINVLNAGALEVPLIQEPVSEFTVSPLLGSDVQTKGLTAIVVSAAVVFVFMLVYYLVAGVVADLSLLLNLILVVGSMAFIEATFTLPGLAGLVLTIGMAVDSNVLIYERMREELARGASLRMAIENGFDKALSTIIDSNVTTLITAVILYMIGSDLIRGFAVSLFIGLTMSLFSCLYFGHLCFNVMERKRWVSSLKMFQLIGVTKFDFLAQRTWAFLISAAVILGGFAALFVRGAENMDIDFSGGTMVTFVFEQPQSTDKVREHLVEQFGGTISLERLVLAGEQTTAEGGKRFRVRTTNTNEADVTKRMAAAFTDPQMALVRLTMEYGQPAPTPPAADPQQPSRFDGGTHATVKFSGPIAEGLVATYLSDQIEKLTTADGKKKYDSADSLILVKGTQAAAEDATATTVVKKYTELEAQVVAQVAPDDFAAALTAMQNQLASSPAFEEVNAFDTSVAQETQRDAILAILASLVAIVIYIWFRFEKVYFGLAAVVALAHDVLVTLGSIALGAYLSRTPVGPLLGLEDFKINLTLVASLLTIVGYSLNDTIVIFDRIREIRGKNPTITYDMINLSVNQTLSRTVLTALTVFLVVIVLYAAGGAGIHGFAYSMIIGVLTGCYSTVYIANPVLYWLVSREKKAGTAPVRSAATAAAT